MDRVSRSFPAAAAALLALAGVGTAPAQESAKTVLKSQSFDRDPGWEARNNRLLPRELTSITQDFGYSRTNFAGNAVGEMGGQVTRASEPAFYADRIEPRTLDQPLSASGSFALIQSTGNGGVFFGFFRAEQPGGAGRPISSLGLDLDGEQTGARLAVRLITGKNQSCGTFVTPFIPGRFRPTPIRNNGTRYTWALEYDPEAAEGRGRFTVTLHGDAPKPEEVETPDLPEPYKQEARSHFPATTTFSVDLPEGFRRQGATFDHFGLMNLMKPGGRMKIYFDDLAYAGRTQEFARDPNWHGSCNRATYQAADVAGAQNFGFSTTHYAGGKPGEIGGVFWRAEKNWAYYADRVGPLTFEDRLEARGRVTLVAGGPDSDMCFGWFRGAESAGSPFRDGAFLGVKVGGPTRVGHYFLPAFTASAEVRGLPKQGPVMEPGRSYEWSLVYDPTANGQGAITAKLGNESVTHQLRPGQKTAAKEALLDRFGMFSIGPGGQIVRLYLDDLQYTRRLR